MNIGLGIGTRYPKFNQLSLALKAISAIRRNGGTLIGIPDNFAGAYIDSTGTTPVTAVGDLVGLLTDRSYGAGNLGVELMTDPSFNDPSKWTPGAGWSITGGSAIATAAASGTNMLAAAAGYSATVANKSYKAEVVITSISGGVQMIIWNGSTNVANTQTITTPGTYQIIYTANNTQCRPYLSAQGASTTLTAASLSQKEVLGNHATQPTTASKPLVAVNAQGKKVISFDGSNDFLQTDITTGNEGWICAGVMFDNSNIQSIVSSGGGGASEKGIFPILLNTANGGPAIRAQIGNGTARAVSEAAMTANTSSVISMGWSSSGVFAGAGNTESTTSAFSGDVTGQFPMKIGVYRDGVTLPLKGPMTAIIYTPVLPSAADRALIRKWVGSLQGQTL